MTSEEVVQAYIERCREVNPLVNAIVEDRFEEALNEARQIDAEIAKGTRTVEEMERDTPLLGLPVTVKGMTKLNKIISKQKNRIAIVGFSFLPNFRNRKYRREGYDQSRWPRV